MSQSKKNRLLEDAHEMATSLQKAAVINKKTMREFDALCLPAVHILSPSKIKRLRQASGVSQAVFAKILNVSLAAIKQWERGERNPSGAALKILNIIETKGIQILF